MSWTADEQRSVSTAILGSWPGTITQWGREAFAAYIGELGARGLSAEAVLLAVRSWPAGSDFPPSAPNLAASARRDPGAPTFDEAYALVYRPKGILWGKSDAQSREFCESGGCHPLVASFALRYGINRLRMLEVDCPDYGDVKKRDLKVAWEAHVEAMDGRDVAALVAPRRKSLGAFDPLAALGAARPELESSTEVEEQHA